MIEAVRFTAFAQNDFLMLSLDTSLPAGTVEWKIKCGSSAAQFTHIAVLKLVNTLNLTLSCQISRLSKTQNNSKVTLFDWKSKSKLSKLLSSTCLFSSFVIASVGGTLFAHFSSACHSKSSYFAETPLWVLAHKRKMLTEGLPARVYEKFSICKNVKHLNQGGADAASIVLHKLSCTVIHISANMYVYISVWQVYIL